MSPTKTLVHCRLDLHKVEEAIRTGGDADLMRAVWFGRWAAKVETFLRDAAGPDEEDEGSNADVERLEAELKDAEDCISMLETAINQAVKALDAIDENNAAREAIDEVAGILENAL